MVNTKNLCCWITLAVVIIGVVVIIVLITTSSSKSCEKFESEKKLDCSSIKIPNSDSPPATLSPPGPYGSFCLPNQPSYIPNVICSPGTPSSPSCTSPYGLCPGGGEEGGPRGCDPSNAGQSCCTIDQRNKWFEHQGWQSAPSPDSSFLYPKTNSWLTYFSTANAAGNLIQTQPICPLFGSPPSDVCSPSRCIPGDPKKCYPPSASNCWQNHQSTYCQSPMTKSDVCHVGLLNCGRRYAPLGQTNACDPNRTDAGGAPGVCSNFDMGYYG
jgi:hypothetical protein